jgi:hypothetical protein
VNLADLLLRHSSANHKRETIAFSVTSHDHETSILIDHETSRGDRRSS